MSEQMSTEEISLYDRQIRLWGFDAQRRLRSSKVLVYGMNGLGAEIIKNLVLTGLKEVTMMDPEILTKTDRMSNFLADQADIGKNRAQACVNRAKALNPNVDVNYDTRHIDDFLDSQETPKWHCIVAIGLTRDRMIRLNKYCRSFQIKLFVADVFGFFGYILSDAQSHIHIAINKISTSPGKIASDSKEENCEIVFPSFEEALNVSMTQNRFSRFMKKYGYLYVLFTVLQNFREKRNRNPTRDDFPELLKLKNKELDNLNLQPDSFDDSLFKCIFHVLSPSCSVIAGLLAQEVNKVLTGRETPLKNFILLDPNNFSTVILNLSPAE